MKKVELSKEELKKKADIVKNQSNGFINEFKKFIMRGNVVDMAVGVIIGAAFGAIITAFTDDFINPLINGIGGASIAGKIKIYGDQYLNWGHFLTAVINFLINAFVLFIVLKTFNKIMIIGKKEEIKDTKKVKSDEVILLEEIRNLLKEKK